MAFETAGVAEVDEPVADATETEVHDTHTTADDLPAEVESTDDASGGGEGSEVSTGVDEELASYAQMYGLDAGDPKSLVKYLSAELDRKIASEGRQTWEKPKQETAPAKTAAEAAAFELAKLLPGELPKGEWDEALIARDKQYQDAIKAMHDHYGSRLSSLKDELTKPLVDRLEAMERFHLQQEQERTDREIDGFFDSLNADPELAKQFGKGSAKGMSPHSQHLKARNAVVEQAIALRDGYAARGMQVPELGQLLKRALNVLHADTVTTTARKQVATQLAANKNRALGTPRRQMPKPLDPEKKAFETLKSKLKEHGFNTASVADDDE